MFAGYEAAGGAALPAGRALLMFVIAVAFAAVALRAGLVPYRWMPLTVGNYVGAFFAVVGALCVSYVVLATRKPITQLLAVPSSPRAIGAALALTAYALITFGAVAHLTWTNFALADARAWVFGVLWVCCFLLFLGDELLVRGAPRRRLGLWAATKLILLVGLVLAVFFLGAPAFLMLLVPVMVILFVWHGAYAQRLYRLTTSPLPAAILNASLFAWVIAATFALVG